MRLTFLAAATGVAAAMLASTAAAYCPPPCNAVVPHDITIAPPSECLQATLDGNTGADGACGCQVWLNVQNDCEETFTSVPCDESWCIELVPGKTTQVPLEGDATRGTHEWELEFLGDASGTHYVFDVTADVTVEPRATGCSVAQTTSPSAQGFALGAAVLLAAASRRRRKR